MATRRRGVAAAARRDAAAGGDRMKSAATVIVLVASCLGAQAGFEDGNALFDACQDGNDNVKWGYCTGYIGGVADSLYAGSSLCLPDNVKFGQLRDVVAEWLRAHPEAAIG